MPLPPKVLRKGITDMVRISDARMSGTAYGTVVLHTAPEAAAGGPLARRAERRHDRARRAEAPHPAAHQRRGTAAPPARPGRRPSRRSSPATGSCTSTTCCRPTRAWTSTSWWASAARSCRATTTEAASCAAACSLARPRRGLGSGAARGAACPHPNPLPEREGVRAHDRLRCARLGHVVAARGAPRRATARCSTSTPAPRHPAACRSAAFPPCSPPPSGDWLLAARHAVPGQRHGRQPAGLGRGALLRLPRRLRASSRAHRLGARCTGPACAWASCRA